MSATKAMATGAGLTTVGSGGVLWWLGENASALGIVFTALTFCVFSAFIYLNYRENKRHNREMENKDD